MRQFARFAATAAAIMSIATSGSALAATLIVNGSGQLTGATGVTVGGSVYDVVFMDTSCVTAFNGCAATSDLNFTTFADSELAAQALLDQVLIDSGAGLFDSDYTLTFGCTTNDTNACRVTIPYQVGFATGQVNQALNTNTTDMTNLAIMIPSQDVATLPGIVYAVFTPSSAAVPEPATWAMMLFGFGAIGFTLRRQKRQQSLETA